MKMYSEADVDSVHLDAMASGEQPLELVEDDHAVPSARVAVDVPIEEGGAGDGRRAIDDVDLAGRGERPLEARTQNGRLVGTRCTGGGRR